MTDPTLAEETTQIKGIIHNVTFHNPDNGFCVLKVALPGKKKLFTVIANTTQVTPGESIEAEGFWHTDPQHGLQFKSENNLITPPHSLLGIEKYFASGIIKGIGATYAKKLVERFGEALLNIMDEEPERLKTIPGIGNKRLNIIIKSWEEQKSIRNIIIFLHSHGIGSSRAVRIYKTYGNESIQKIQRNPYCLARDINGIGFQTSDEVATQLGIAPTSLERITAGLEHVLDTFANEGHCAAEKEMWLKSAKDLLNVEPEIIEEGMAQAQALGLIITEDVNNIKYYYKFRIHQAEQIIAKKLISLKKRNCPWTEINTTKAIAWLEHTTAIQLSPSQKDALSKILNSKVSIITGGPGVGKTTLVNSILHILKRKGIKIKLCAPTGRAAKRLTESTGITAKTIHRLLEYQPHVQSFKYNEYQPLTTDLLVVDEASMVDIHLMFSLLVALPAEASLILVGDIDQLPSIGPGAILKDCIMANCFNVVHLTEVFRQAKTSRIIANAHRINEGLMPFLTHEDKQLTDFYFIPEQNEAAIQEKIIHLVAHRIPKRFNLNPIEDIQVLTPMQRSGLGAQSLNIQLQKALNPHFSIAINRFGSTYAVGDKVMQIINNYDKEVYNGDIGFILNIDEIDKILTVQFEQRLINYEFNELDELQLAYACTIHKSQGSEYPAVVIPVTLQHFIMLQRNLLYTGVTRGKALVVLVGQPRALATAINHHQSKERITGLQWRLKCLDNPPKDLF